MKVMYLGDVLLETLAGMHSVEAAQDCGQLFQLLLPGGVYLWLSYSGTIFLPVSQSGSNIQTTQPFLLQISTSADENVSQGLLAEH